MKKIAIFSLILLICHLSYSIPFAEDNQSEKSEWYKDNLGIYGFYVGQTLSSALENACKRGLKITVYTSIIGHSGGQVNSKYKHIADIVKNKVNQIQDTLEKIQNGAPASRKASTSNSECKWELGNRELLFSNTFLSTPQGFLNDPDNKVIGDFGDYINLTKKDFINFCNQVEYKLPYEARTTYNFEINVSNIFGGRNNYGFCMLYFTCDLYSDDEPILYFISITLPDKDFIDSAIQVLNQRYGKYKVISQGWNGHIAWAKGECYASLAPNGGTLDFIDYTIYKDFISHYTGMLNDIEDKERSEAERDM